MAGLARAEVPPGPWDADLDAFPDPPYLGLARAGRRELEYVVRRDPLAWTYRVTVRPAPPRAAPESDSDSDSDPDSGPDSDSDASESEPGSEPGSESGSESWSEPDSDSEADSGGAARGDDSGGEGGAGRGGGGAGPRAVWAGATAEFVFGGRSPTLGGLVSAGAGERYWDYASAVGRALRAYLRAARG